MGKGASPPPNNQRREIVSFVEDDFLGKDYKKYFNKQQADVILSLDVIEHIDKERENDFLNTVDINLNMDGIAIIGTPNATMKEFSGGVANVLQ